MATITCCIVNGTNLNDSKTVYTSPGSSSLPLLFSANISPFILNFFIYSRRWSDLVDHQVHIVAQFPAVIRSLMQLVRKIESRITVWTRTTTIPMLLNAVERSGNREATHNGSNQQVPLFSLHMGKYSAKITSSLGKSASVTIYTLNSASSSTIVNQPWPISKNPKSLLTVFSSFLFSFRVYLFPV